MCEYKCVIFRMHGIRRNVVLCLHAQKWMEVMSFQEQVVCVCIELGVMCLGWIVSELDSG